jgi:1-acyl-sn-glycerol-3-phosphate acyltransferase
MTDDFLGKVSVSPWLYGALLPIHRLFLSLYFSQIIIHGFENLPVNGPVVLAPKHYSRWDPLILGILSLEPFWFMTNANQFVGVQEWFLRRLGAFPVDLARPKVSSYRYAIHLLGLGKKLVMFPEGGIVRDQVLRPLKPGLARLVLQAEVSVEQVIPVVPIALCYTPEPLWRGKITLCICPPLYTKHHWQGDEKKTAQVLTQAIERSLLKGLGRIMVSR